MTTRRDYIINNIKGFMSQNPDFTEEEAKEELLNIWNDCNGDVDAADCIDLNDAFTFDIDSGDVSIK